MELPEGVLLRSRVITDVATALADVLDREVTGYVRLEPQEALLDDGDVGLVTFEDGVPVAAYHSTDRTGSEALSRIASGGPYRFELYELERETLAAIHDDERLRVPPALPARRLADDEQLVERVRAAAAPGRQTESTEHSELDAVEQFLDDNTQVEQIKQRARTEAQSRAQDWNLPTDGSGET